MPEGSMALHRRAERWMFAADIFGAQGKVGIARWCRGRAAVWERRALDNLREQAPERVRTIAIIAESARSLEAKSRA